MLSRSPGPESSPLSPGDIGVVLLLLRLLLLLLMRPAAGSGDGAGL